MVYLINIINELFRIYTFIILARVLLSWVQPNPYNPIVQFIYNITEPVLRPFRVIIKASSIGVDLSPIIAFLVLEIVRRIIIGLLRNMVG